MSADHVPAVPEDRRRSPYTGWTRRHWEALADALLAAVRPHATPGNALVHLPGPAGGSGRWSDGLEGYARTFLLAAFRCGTLREPDATVEWYARGLAAGTDPGSPERWPRPDEVRQARVEAASVALALHETRHLLWDRLPDAVRQRAVAWLGGMSGAEVPDNNWVWFRAVVAAFLRSVGAPYRAADIDHAVARTEQWYAGGGWYSDGARNPGEHRNFDHYNGWAMHLYPLWYCRMAGPDAAPGLPGRYRGRLRAFLAAAPHLIGADGSPLVQGRSLTYRFAAAAPLWAGALFDATPLPPGLTRRAASGVVRHFTDAGAVDGSGLLTLGWHHPFEPIRQRYSGPASPYWAAKGFIGLLLPPDHPVWTAAEEPLPVERADFVLPLPAPGWIASGTAADGVVRVANHGADHTPADAPARDDPFYARHAYSTRTAPDLPPRPPAPPADPEAHHRDGDARDGAAPDSHVALLDASGAPSHRSPLQRLAVSGRCAVSRHRPHWPPPAGDPLPRREWPSGPWLTTASVLRGPWEVRLVRVDGDPGGRRLRVGGHAVAAAAPPAAATGARSAAVTGPDGLTSEVRALDGTPQVTPVVHRAEGANPLGRHSATPCLETAAEPPRGRVLAFAVLLTAAPPPGPAPAVRCPAPSTARITWPDGETDEVTLPAPPPPGRP
ncbi:DUF2264 domain-containing protein [Streptomyces capparidis]